jgi:hypothetical protein
MVIDSLNHKGTEFCSAKLGYQVDCKVSLDMDKVNYMNNVALTLDAVLELI